METSTENCFFCEKELSESTIVQNCIYCGKSEEVQLCCPDHHFVCNTCKEKNVWDVIDNFCFTAASANPVQMAETLMKFPGFKMHCPDHHYLVPAVLLASYSKKLHKRKKLAGWLKIARNRAEKVPGGFCGTHGSCGAAVGTGIFISAITGATPLSGMEWNLSNSVVGHSLLSMAQYGGPRCCKRVTFLSLQEAGNFLRERLSVQLEMPEKIECTFSQKNEEQCLKEHCPFYPVQN